MQEDTVWYTTKSSHYFWTQIINSFGRRKWMDSISDDAIEEWVDFFRMYHMGGEL